MFRVPRGRGSPTVFLALAGLLVLVGSALWLLSGEYAFLVVEESGSIGPAHGWIGQEEASAAWYQPEGQQLFVREGAVRPWHRWACLYEMDGAGVLLESRLFTGFRFPACLPLTQVGRGLLSEGTRLLAGDLEVLGRGGDGRLRLRYDGREFSLRPGESWAELRVQGVGGTFVYSRGDVTAWESAAEEAVANHEPATRILVTYHGLWPRGRVARGEAP